MCWTVVVYPRRLFFSIKAIIEKKREKKKKSRDGKNRFGYSSAFNPAVLLRIDRRVDDRNSCVPRAFVLGFCILLYILCVVYIASSCWGAMLKLERLRSNAADLWLTHAAKKGRRIKNKFKKKTRQFLTQRVTGSSYNASFHIQTRVSISALQKWREAHQILLTSPVHCLSSSNAYADLVTVRCEGQIRAAKQNHFSIGSYQWPVCVRHCFNECVTPGFESIPLVGFFCYLNRSKLDWWVWGIMLYNVAYCSNYSTVNYHHQQQVCQPNLLNMYI